MTSWPSAEIIRNIPLSPRLLMAHSVTGECYGHVCFVSGCYVDPEEASSLKPISYLSGILQRLYPEEERTT